jgi:hypothetical protein
MAQCCRTLIHDNLSSITLNKPDTKQRNLQKMDNTSEEDIPCEQHCKQLNTSLTQIQYWRPVQGELAGLKCLQLLRLPASRQGRNSSSEHLLLGFYVSMPIVVGVGW